MPLVCLAFNTQAKSAPLTDVDQQRITAQLAASSPLLDPEILVTRGSSADYQRVLSDPELVKFATMNFKQADAAYAKYLKSTPAARRQKEPFTLSRFGGFLALTMAFNSVPLNEKGKKQLSGLQQRWSHVLDNPAYRSNCYTFAMGDNTSNQLLMMASPGQRVSGLSFEPSYHHSDVVRSATMDGLVFAGTDPAKLVIPQGQRVVMMYHKLGHDYHWVRLDRTHDGELAASSKFGVEPEIRHWPVKDIYAEMKRTYANAGEEGYTFRAFFLIPEGGIDVGVDAYYKNTGEMEPVADWRKTSPEQARAQDFFILRKAMSNK